MDLASLRIFSTVVQEGGITRAAEKLHRVQSNVTTRVRQLEEELGTPLFIREGKRLHLAPAGRILLEYADRILDLADEAQAAVGGTGPRGHFKLGSMESTAAVRLPEPLSRYSRRYPDVTLELTTGNPVQLASAVLDGDVDAALVAEPVAESKFDSVLAFEEEPVIVTAMNHPPIEDPGSVPGTMLVFEHGCPNRRRFEAWYVARKDAPERVIELGSYHAMLGCVLAGMGAAFLPRSVLKTFPESKRLRVHKVPDTGERLRTFLIWRKGVKSPNVAALAEILTDENPCDKNPRAA
jgi:DNA-binding transcriptional LysR family regulator